MNLSALLSTLRALPEYQTLADRAGSSIVALGLPRAARLPFVAAIASHLNRPALLITARSDRALIFNEELHVWLPDPNSPILQSSNAERLVSSPQSPISSDLPLTTYQLHLFPEPNPLP